MVYIGDEELIDWGIEEFDENNFDLYDAMDKLDIKYKSVLVLRFFEDMKIEDISKVLELNENTVKTRLNTALKNLRIEMEAVVI